MRRLSEIKGDEVVDLIADLIVPIAEIAADEDAAEIFQKRELPTGMTPTQFAMQRIRKSMPVLLKAHKEDLLTIMSLLAGETVEAYTESMTMASLISDLVSITTDPMLRQFFG